MFLQKVWPISVKEFDELNTLKITKKLPIFFFLQYIVINNVNAL